ncbi:hypothetical protein TNCV_4545551 [Trichonephila clavipes]|nr:hypothetical protein TNCV_4545551 [Trichonephila clavipes]
MDKSTSKQWRNGEHLGPPAKSVGFESSWTEPITWKKFVPNHVVGGLPRQRIFSVDVCSRRRLKEIVLVERIMDINFCVRLGKSAMETYEVLNQVYGCDTVSRMEAFE